MMKRLRDTSGTYKLVSMVGFEDLGRIMGEKERKKEGKVERERGKNRNRETPRQRNRSTYQDRYVKKEREDKER